MKKPFITSGYERPKGAMAYPLPLLIQGSPILTCLSGFVQEQNFTTATGRGSVYAVDVYNSQDINAPVTGQIGGETSLVIGGQSIFENVNTDMFANLYAADTHARTFTPVDVDSSQTVRLIANQVPTTAGTRATLQTLLYYTNEAHSDFVRKYGYRNSGLGQKRTAFRLRISAGIGASTVVQNGVVPKNLGPITAVQILLGGVGAGQQDLIDGEFTVDLAIDGVTIIENINAQMFTIPSFKRPQIFPINIIPGATYELRVRYTGALLALDFDVYTQFYFGN